MSNRFVFAGAGALCMVLGVAATPASAMGAKAFMKTVDADADKTISKDEVDAYAKKRFVELDPDRDSKLDAKELKTRLSAAGMKAADPDNDKLIDEDEFVAYVDKLFVEANKKGDETLSVQELESAAGRKLIQLLE